MDFFDANLQCVGSDSKTPANGRCWTATNGVLDFTTVDQDASVSPGLANYTGVKVVSDTTSYRLTSDGKVEEVVNGVATRLPDLPAGTWGGIEFLIANDGVTPSVGFACGDTYRIYKTTRPALSAVWGAWTATTPPGTPTHQLRKIQFPTSMVGYACGDGLSILKSTNSGATWSEQLPGAAKVTPNLHSIHFPVDVTHGWVVGDTGTIGFTIDGATWNTQVPANTLTTPPAVNLYDVWFSDNSSGFIVGDVGSVMRTTDGGNTWLRAPPSTGPNPDLPVQFNAVDFTSNGSVGVLVGLGGNMYRTLNGGATWTNLNNSKTEDLFGVSIPRGGTGTVAYACGASGRIIQITQLQSGLPVLTPTTLGASTWRAILFPAGDGTGAVGGDGPSLGFTTTGTAWNASTNPATLPTTAWLALSSDVGGLDMYVGGTQGKVAHSANQGASWSDATAVASAASVLSFQSPTATTLVSGTADGKVNLSNGGAWSLATTQPTAANPQGMSFPDALTGWLVTSTPPFTGGVFASTDGGMTWGQLYVHTKNQLRATWFSPTVPGLGYAVGDNGTVLKTVSGGK
jgi:photosystem II stability/assembly factor-like uncharacterized protein